MFFIPADARMLNIQTKKGVRSFDVELAVTSEEQQKGLMFRSSLSDESGVLFVGYEEKIWNMWMKNTLIPLDMIFINSDGKIVKIIQKTRPLDETILSSDIPVQSVLEIAGGQAAEQGIKVGDKVMLP